MPLIDSISLTESDHLTKYRGDVDISTGMIPATPRFLMVQWRSSHFTFESATPAASASGENYVRWDDITPGGTYQVILVCKHPEGKPDMTISAFAVNGFNREDITSDPVECAV